LQPINNNLRQLVSCTVTSNYSTWPQEEAAQQKQPLEATLRLFIGHVLLLQR